MWGFFPILFSLVINAILISEAVSQGDTFFSYLRCPFEPGEGTPPPFPSAGKCYRAPEDSRYLIVWKPFLECPPQAGAAPGCYWVQTFERGGWLSNTYTFEGDWVIKSDEGAKILTGFAVFLDIVWILWGCILIRDCWKERKRRILESRLPNILDEIISEGRVPFVPLEISEKG